MANLFGFQLPTTPSFAPDGDPLNALFAALAKAIMQQQSTAGGRLQLQRDQTFGQHLGTGGAPVTPENPLGYPGGSPFDNGFFKSGAADLTPEQTMLSQGGNAINQWKRPDLFGGMRPPTSTPAQAAMAASPDPFQISPSSKAFLRTGEPLNNLGAVPRGQQVKRKGRDFSFGSGGSPRKGFSFGSGM